MTDDYLPEVPDGRVEAHAEAAPSSDVAQALLLLPNFVKLTYRLMRDPRVARRDRLAAVLALGYAVSPVDLIPDFLPAVGRLDDVLVVAAALRHLLRAAGPEVAAEHWDGRGDVLYAVDSALHAVADLLPRRLGGRTLGRPRR